MESIQNYRVIKKVHERRDSVAYQAEKTSSQEPVFLEIINPGHASPSEIARFKHEYEKIRTIDSQGIFETYDIFDHHNGIAIVSEPFFGIPLYRRFTAGDIDIPVFLSLAANLTRTLGDIHSQGIVHHAITPDTIFCDPSGEQVKLNGFAAYGTIARINEKIYDPWVIRHSLPYLAPEQTGRINSVVDYRADLYALGVVFYELLTGAPPFLSDDPIEIIHAHIARQPEAPMVKNAAVPGVLSEIVMKLLSKTIEDRYQSGYGAMADFNQCARKQNEIGEIRDFVPGQTDRPIGFHMPEKLFGRESEVGKVMAAFDRVAGGANEIFLVAGQAGIGKSSLVKEIHKPLVARRAYFIAGKAEQYKRNVPYYPINQAFTEFARLMLCESDARVAAWKKRILDAVGSNARLLTEFIPDFEYILGRQKKIPFLGPEEAAIRFNFVFREFVKACAADTHPLVIFIDDLQWADTASLDFLRMLALTPEISHLLIIGAYRDNTTSATHALTMIMDDMKKKGASVSLISLSSLSAAHVNQLLSYVLRCDAAETSELSGIVHNKARGNPFFIHQFLKILYEGNILFLNPESGFTWDIEKVIDLQVTDNVVDFMAGKIARLPVEIRETLRVCACYGNRFNLFDVAACHDKTLDAVIADLSTAEDEGLVNFAGDTGIFCHDRIREAVYRLFSQDDRKQTHYTIGRHLLDNTPPARLGEKTVDVVNHLNIARDLVQSASEQIELARLNGRAGEKALSSGAFEMALQSFQTAIELLETADTTGDNRSYWEVHYELALWLYNGCAEAAYLTVDYDTMYRLTEAVIRHAHSVNDQVKVQIVRLHALMAQNRLDEVLQDGLSFLELLGIPFSRKTTPIHTLWELTKTRLAIRGKKPSDFLNLPMMTDPTVQAQVDIMATITSTAYWAAPNFLPIILFRLMRIFIKHGNTGFSPYVYAGYGLILCTLEKIDKGYEFGQMALSLLAEMDVPRYRSRTLMVVNTFVRHWKEHGVNTVAPLLEAVKSGTEHGDPEFAGHSMMVIGYTRFLLGAPLDELDGELQEYKKGVSRLGQTSNLNVLQIYHQTVLNLKDRVDNPCALVGEAYNEKKMLAVHENANDQLALRHLYYCKLMVNILFDNTTDAYRYAERTMACYIRSGAGSLFYPAGLFYDSLIRLTCFDHGGYFTKRRIRYRVARSQKKMARWARHSPANFLHKYHLVEGERARIKGRDKDAVAYYKKAFHGALENEYIQEAALAAEYLGRFYSGHEITDFAAFYISQALELYIKWGAHAKALQLEEKYGELIDAAAVKPAAASSGDSPAAASADGKNRLDINAMMKMSHAISSEIQLEKLLVTLMRVILENSGAEKAFLILNRNDRFVVDAKADINADDVSVLQSVPLEKSPELSFGVISYVRRTREPLVLDDAQKENRFAGDPHIRDNAVRSVLCMPLVRQQHVIGLIYMENNLTPNAFTPMHREMVTLLSTQAANCLENAIFFEGIAAAEKRAQKQREEYQKLIETMNDGLVITDSGLTVNYVNKAACRIFGYTAEEMIGKAVFDFVDKDNQKKIAAEANNWAQLTRHVFEIEGIAKDAGVISMIVSPKPLYNEDGEFSGFLAIVTDVTDLKKAQAEKELAQTQLIQSQKMEAIGTLAGGVAHDFNNYLMIIIGSIDLIEIKDNLPDDLKKHVSNIKNAASSSAALTRQLLAFSRRQRLEAVNVDLNNVVADIEKMLKRLIGENIRLTTALTPELKRINADYGQMEQIIMNLAINARDAMPNGGRLHLKTCNVMIDDAYCQQIRYAKPGAFVRLTVEDTGFGMDRETADKIFDPFFSTKAIGEGTGLGLSVVYGVVKQHNGWINAYSEPGQGTTFRIYIPVADTPADQNAAGKVEDAEQAAGLYPGNQERILVIEDQPEVRSVVTTALTTSGYIVSEAESLSRARKCLAEENGQFDLLFSDVILPDGNGIEFAETVSHQYPDMKVILSSGYTEENARPDKIREKEFHFLQKPYQIAKMLETIKTVLSTP